MRAGKIDLMMGVKAENALAVQKTNPEIVLLMNPRPQALTLQPANNKPPFNDIRVRKAMQLAIDLRRLPGITITALSIHILRW